MSRLLPARRGIGVSATVLALATASFSASAPADHPPSELIGLWQGTSLCTDRVAAPACHDEVIVYEFAAGSAAGTLRWKADKVVDGTRESMGDDLDMAWDASAACWKAEFKSARAHVVWCLAVRGGQLVGSAWLLPGRQTVRKVEAHRGR